MKKIKRILQSNIGFLIILTVVIFAIYGKTVHYEFTKLDDDMLISRNINFISQIKNIPRLFLTSCYYSDSFFYYRPVLSLSFAFESILTGNKIKIYHFSNIILFILCIYLMYVFLTLLKYDRKLLKFVCLLIASHPMFSSCVAWLPARNDTLLFIFICLSFINLTYYVKFKKKSYLSYFTLFFAAALFTKETAVIFLPLCVFYLYFFNIKPDKIRIKYLLTAALSVSALYFYMRSIAISGGHSLNLDMLNYYMANGLKGSIIYIYKFFIPSDLPLMLYNIKLNFTAIATNLVFLFFLFWAFSKKIIRGKTIVFLFVWTLSWIAPTFLMNDYALLFHRFIIASVFFGATLTEIAQNLTIKFDLVKKYLVLFFAVLFGSYSFASYNQADKYKNAPVFWAHAYSDAPDYHLTCYGLAQRFLETGDSQKALELLISADRYMPLRYRTDIASLLIRQKRFNEAEIILLDTATASNSSAIKYFVYGTLSKLYIEKKDFTKALDCALKASSLNNNDTEILKLLVTAYSLNGKYQQALSICTELLKYDPQNAQYYYKAAELYELMKDYKNAKKHISQGLKLAPENIQLIEKAESLKRLNNETN